MAGQLDAARERGKQIEFDVERLMDALEKKKKAAALAATQTQPVQEESAVERLTRLARDGKAAAAAQASPTKASTNGTLPDNGMHMSDPVGLPPR